LIFIAVGSSTAQDGSIDFNEVLSFSVPGLGTIEKYDFGDVNFDGFPEILASDGNSAVLYSYRYDSVLFTFSLDTLGSQRDWFTYGLVIADINRDYFPDLVIGGYSTQDLASPFLRLYFYNGTGFWGDPDSLFLEFPSSISWMVFGEGLDLFDAVDFNNDGYTEFVFSCDSGVGGSITRPDVLYGITNVYYSFPDSILYHDNVVHSRARTLPEPYAEYTTMRQHHESYWSLAGTGNISSETTFHFYQDMIDGGMSMNTSSLPWTLYCSKESRSGNYGESSVGDIDPDAEGIEMIAGWGKSLCCLDGPDPVCTTSTGTGLFQFVPPNRLEKLYDIVPGSIIGYPVFLPQYPGSFFSLSDDSIYQYDGRDGSLIRSAAFTLSGDRNWTDPFDGNNLYMVMTQSNTITVYAPNVITDADDNSPPLLPTTLNLGKPYPNPFNATQTIPVKIIPGHELTVDVFNLLGQKVKALYTGRPSASALNLTWKADNLPSGIYFVRAIAEDGNSAFVRSILLK